MKTMTEKKVYQGHLSQEDHHCVQLVPLFNQLAPEELRQIEQLVYHRTFAKGETVISPDAEAQLTIVAQGQLKIYQLSVTGREQLLRVIEPGSYEGENALFGAVNENLFGQSLTELRVCFIRQKDFHDLLLKHPELSLRFLEINAQKSKETQQQAQFLMMEEVEERLAYYLWQLIKAENSNYVTLPMKMKDLADFIGTSPETLSRKFKSLERKGFIEREGKMIKLLDLEKFEDEYA